MTVGQWLDVWLAEYMGDKKYLTVKGYKAQCNTHIKPAMAKDHSRLGRNRIVIGQLLEEVLEEYGVRYIAIGDGIDTFSYFSTDLVFSRLPVIADSFALFILQGGS